MKKERIIKEDSPLVSLAKHGKRTKKNTLRNMLTAGAIMIAAGVTTIGFKACYYTPEIELGPLQSKIVRDDYGFIPGSKKYKELENNRKELQTQETSYNND